MYKYILLLALCSCGAFSEQAVEDFIEGEAQVAEKVVQDVSGNSASKAPAKVNL
jgi:hypothetical protein